ncbi:MAG: lipopolysaccharide assembly protein LapA domain-containing protein [Mycobacterium sp.]|uniref:LapA family protein n=1 Tax=Mycobacterium sp. TaxID=1785 RepID=UPI003CC50226
MSTDHPVPPEKRAPVTSSSAQVPPVSAVATTPESARFTRAGAVWSALTVGFLILIVLLVFISQNTTSPQFAFLGWRWSMPLGVAILLAAVFGGLITVLAGTARIFQLRRAAKKDLIARG